MRTIAFILSITVAGCATQTEHPVTPSNDAHAREQRRDAGWVSVGIGSIAGVVALGTGYVMLHDQSVRSSACTNKQCTQEGLDANSQLKSIQDWNTGAWIVAAVGLGLGAFLVITNSPESDDKQDEKQKNKGQTSIGVMPNGSGATLGIGRSF